MWLICLIWCRAKLNSQQRNIGGLRSPSDSIIDVTALILCGGRGERLRPLTDEIPKPLLSVNGRPLLAYLMRHLHDRGIRDFLFCTGYKAEMFEEFAHQSASCAWRIRCQNAGEADIAERLRAAQQLVHGRALVCYGDTLADVDLAELRRVHETRRVEATLTVFPYRSPFGIVAADEDNMATGFEEKPQLPYWVNIGFMLCEPTAFARLRPGTDFPTFLEHLARERTLGVHRHLGRHWTANTEQELRDLATQLRNPFNQQDDHDTEQT